MKTVQVSDECWERIRGVAFSTRETLGAVIQRAMMFLPVPSGSVAEKNEKGGGDTVPVTVSEMMPTMVPKKKGTIRSVPADRSAGSVVGKMAETLANFGPGTPTPDQKMVLTDIQEPDPLRDGESRQFQAGDIVSMEVPAATVNRALAAADRLASARTPETICGRCGQAWKNHQDGSKKNRAPLTGCSTFQDPKPEMF